MDTVVTDKRASSAPATDQACETLATILLPAEPTETPAEAAVDYEKMVFETVQAIRQVAQAGDQLAAIAILPEWEDGFKAALSQVAEELLPAAVRDSLPIEVDPGAQGINIITRTDLEMQFLAQYFGPRDRGGTGLLPLLQDHLNRHQSPVRVTPDFLRNTYLAETVARFGPQLVTPGQLDLTRIPNLRRS